LLNRVEISEIFGKFNPKNPGLLDFLSSSLYVLLTVFFFLASNFFSMTIEGYSLLSSKTFFWASYLGPMFKFCNDVDTDRSFFK